MSTYESYDKTSGHYDDMRRPIDVAHLLESVKSVAQAKQIPLEELQFLDIGCGTGNYIMEVAKNLKCQCFGIEHSIGMLEKLRSKSKGLDNIAFQQGDATRRLPFEDNSFDFVMASQMFHHLPSEQGIWKGAKNCLSEVARLARPGGSKFWLQTQTKQQHVEGKSSDENTPTLICFYCTLCTVLTNFRNFSILGRFLVVSTNRACKS